MANARLQTRCVSILVSGVRGTHCLHDQRSKGHEMERLQTLTGDRFVNAATASRGPLVRVSVDKMHEMELQSSLGDKIC